MFLDQTLNTTNNKKHKMIIPFIEQFKENIRNKSDIELDEKIKQDILSKLCRRCAFSQLESIIDIFQLDSNDNRLLARNFINEQLEHHQQDIVFISHLTKFLKLFENNVLSFEKIVILLILKSQWETIRFVIGDDQILQKKFLQLLDNLISSDKILIQRIFTDYSITAAPNLLDTHSLKRAARKFLKQYQLNLQDFPNLAVQEKISYMKTLFVRKYIEKNDTNNDWNEQIKVPKKTFD